MKKHWGYVLLLAFFASVAFASNTIYEYEDVTERPDLDVIEQSINNSDITTKTHDIRWDEDSAKITVVTTGPLDATDKSTLDTIIATNT